MSADPILPRWAIIVMGVTGSGKTTVAVELARVRHAPFVEVDRLHPSSNIRKMSSGLPLSDRDRWPWLDRIARRITQEPAEELIVACSALKRIYRERLRQGSVRPLAFLYLSGAPSLIAARLDARSGHFMPPGLLSSQLDTLEDPSGEPRVVRVDIDASIADIVAQADAELAVLRASDCAPGG
jgi:gluconokinase